MKNFFYGFYWSGVWIGICFLAFAGRLFSPEAFLALFFIALVLSLPWNIFALLLGILLMMLIHPIGDFSVFWGGEGGALGAMIGDSLIAIAIGLHINGMWFISYRKKRQQCRMEKEQEQEREQARRQA